MDKSKEARFEDLVNTVRMMREEKEADATQIIKDLAKSYGGSNEEQGKMVQLLRGLAFSDDPASNKFMKALDKWTTEYANSMNEEVQLDEVSNRKTKFNMDTVKSIVDAHPKRDILMKAGIFYDPWFEAYRKELTPYFNRSIGELVDKVLDVFGLSTVYRDKILNSSKVQRWINEEVELNEAKMSDKEVLAAAKKLAKNGKNEKTKKFGQGLVDFYEKNKSFTPEQVGGLQNIMKNASFQMAKDEE